jgi:hypothetical protein
MLQLEALYFGSADGAVRSAAAGMLQRAAFWLGPRVGVMGLVSDEGNTRTSNDIETSPEHKLINYPEVALALGYAGVVFSDEALVEAGSAAAGYYLRASF